MDEDNSTFSVSSGISFAKIHVFTAGFTASCSVGMCCALCGGSSADLSLSGIAIQGIPLGDKRVRERECEEARRERIYRETGVNRREG